MVKFCCDAEQGSFFAREEHMRRSELLDQEQEPGCALAIKREAEEDWKSVVRNRDGCG